jgi:hypothetical protein
MLQTGRILESEFSQFTHRHTSGFGRWTYLGARHALMNRIIDQAKSTAASVTDRQNIGR